MNLERLFTTTSQSLAPVAIDTIHQSSPWTGMLLGNNVKPWDQGTYERQPIQFEDTNTAVDFVGLTPFGTAQVAPDINMQWESRGLGADITLSYHEIALNQTKAQVISLVKRQTDIKTNELVRAAASRLYGLGTGSVIEGLALSTDDGSQTSSYGGLARNQYGTVINGQVTPALNGVISFESIEAQIDLCSAAASANHETNLLLTTKPVWSFVEDLMEDKSRINYDTAASRLGFSPYNPGGVAMGAELTGLAGYNRLYIRGIPMVKDDYATSQALYTLNMNFNQFVSVSFPYCETVKMAPQVTNSASKDTARAMNTAWQLSQVQKAYNQLGQTRQLFFSGNYVNRAPARSGVITGITGN